MEPYNIFVTFTEFGEGLIVTFLINSLVAVAGLCPHWFLLTHTEFGFSFMRSRFPPNFFILQNFDYMVDHPDKHLVEDLNYLFKKHLSAIYFK